MASIKEINDEAVLSYALMQLSFVLRKTKGIRKDVFESFDMGKISKEIEVYIEGLSKFDQAIIGARLHSLSKEMNQTEKDQECFFPFLDMYFIKK